MRPSRVSVVAETSAEAIDNLLLLLDFHLSPSLLLFSHNRMSSDSEQPTTSRRSALSDKKQARRAALDRLKNASTTRPRPSFLGADDNDDDDGAPNPFDGLGAIRAGAAKKRQAGGNADREGRVPRDPLLDRVFDDLFDLDGPSGSGGAAGSDDVAGVAGEGDDVEGAPAKKRRVVARMDETRLMGPLGFPKLREELKKVKIKGKGHEVRLLFGSFHPPSFLSAPFTLSS